MAMETGITKGDQGGQVRDDKAEIVTLQEWGKIALQTGMLPKDTNISQAMAMVQAGKEMGLHPLQSVRCMSFIRGRIPSGRMAAWRRLKNSCRS